MGSSKFAKIRISEILIPKDRKITRISKQLIQLSESIRTYGQLEPIGVYKFNHWKYKYKLVYGNNRIYALKLLKQEEIYAKIIDDPSKHNEISYAENMFRKNYTLDETAEIITRILGSNLLQEDGTLKKATLKDVSKIMGKSPTYISYYKSYIEAPTELKMLVKSKKIKDIYIVYELYKLYKKQITEENKKAFISQIKCENNITRDTIKKLKNNNKLTKKYSDTLSVTIKLGSVKKCISINCVENMDLDNLHFKILKLIKE